MLSSSTTAITTLGTVIVPGTVETAVTTAFTSYILSTVTQISTATVVASSPTPTTYRTLSTYSTVFTQYPTSPAPTIPTGSSPTPTVITGGPGEVSGVTIIGTVYQQWMYFLCPSRDCSPWREWLTFIPNVAAGWVIGVIALLLGLALLALAFMCGGLEFIFGFLAMVFLAICLFLRAALKSTSGDKFAMYKASIWLNYFAAVLLLLLLAHLIFRLIVHLDNTLCNTVRGFVAFVYVVSLALFGLLIAAVVLMFDLHSFDKMHSGIRCLQAFAIIILVMTAIELALVWWATTIDVDWHHMGHVVIIGLSLVFLLVWSCFMTARAFITLHDSGRYSEALWYVFNVAMLLLIAIVLLALNAPKMFTFHHCQVNPCPACAHQVNYGPGRAVSAPANRDQIERNIKDYYM